MTARAYRLLVTRTAQKEILGLPAKIRRQVEATIDRLVSTVNQGNRTQDIKPIKGDLDAYRIDSGEYRVLFYLYDHDALVQVTRVLHRKDAYRHV
ncbi:MAG: type II toxin-antitoxin system RelE/ParE family toxin [Dehalococcoidia bacterium]|nr:type II toxin-antitoxin system RelE/ParE family toxin [Dehalococcoidia bacterium]